MPTFAGLTRSSWLRDVRAVAQPPQFSPSALDGMYRVPSIFLSLPLARLGATANGVTVAWIAAGLAGVLALAADSWWIRIGGALLLQLSYLLDFVDGEVARLRAQSSRVGAFLDLVGHGLIKTSLPLATAWTAAAYHGQQAPWMIVGALGAATIGVGDALRFYAAVVAGDLASGDLARARRAPARTGSPAWRRARRIARAAFSLTFESPGLYGLALVGAVLDRLDVVAVIWAAGGTVWFLRRAAHFAARLREPEVAAAAEPPDPAVDATDCR